MVPLTKSLFSFGLSFSFNKPENIKHSEFCFPETLNAPRGEAEWTQRSNVGHAQMGTFLATVRQFPTQKFKGKHGKQPVSRKIYEKKLKSS